MRRSSLVIIAVTAPVALALLTTPLLRPSHAESAYPRITLSAEPPAAPSRRTKHPKAIALLREARQQVAQETRPGSRETLLCYVAEWLNYAGDSETAMEALREARELARPGGEAKAVYGRMQHIATLMADCGDTRAAMETARMAETEQERAWALYHVATHLAKCDVRDGAWEAFADLRDESHRHLTLREIGETALRVGDYADLHRAIEQMPRDQRTSFAEQMAKRLEKENRKEGAEDIRRKFPPTEEQKKASDSLFGRLFGALSSGKPVDIAEAKQFLRLDVAYPSPQFLLVEIGSNLYKNGNKEEAYRLWDDLAKQIEKQERRVTTDPIDFAGDTEGAITVPEEDMIAAAIAQDLSQCSRRLGSSSPEGSSLFLSRALKAANRIDTLPLHTQTISNMISYCLTVDNIPDSLALARLLRGPDSHARELCRIAREQTWIEDRKRALETLREAERMTTRVPDLRERTGLLCALAIARKRAGDLPGARRLAERAEGNFNELADWQRTHVRISLVQALGEVEREADARKVLGGIKDTMPQVWALIRMANAHLPDERPLRRVGPGLL